MLGFLGKVFAHKITKSRSNKRILIHVFAAGITTISVYLIHISFSFEWFYLFLYFPLTVGLFLGIMALFREFTSNDIEFYLNTIHPGKMKNYMVEEIRGHEKN